MITAITRKSTIRTRDRDVLCLRLRSRWNLLIVGIHFLWTSIAVDVLWSIIRLKIATWIYLNCGRFMGPNTTSLTLWIVIPVERSPSFSEREGIAQPCLKAITPSPVSIGKQQTWKELQLSQLQPYCLAHLLCSVVLQKFQVNCGGCPDKIVSDKEADPFYALLKQRVAATLLQHGIDPQKDRCAPL